MKIKIVYVSKYPIENIKNWSGVPKNIFLTFKKKGFDVTKIDTISLVPLNFLKIIELILKFLNIKYDPNRSILLSKYYAFLIDRKISNKKYNYIFSHDSTLLSFLKTKIPVILWTDLTYDLYEKTYLRDYKKISQNTVNGNFLEKKALDKCSKIIYSNKYALKNAREKYKIKKNKLFFVPYGSNIEKKITKKNCNKIIYNKVPSKSESIKFLSIGIDWHRKGMDKTVEFINYIQKKIKKTIQLDLVGDPNFIVKNNKNIINHGYLSKNNRNQFKKIKKLYEEANFFILLSREEAAAVVLMEAAAFGLPIITNEIGGVKSVVNKNGIFFKKKDSLESKYNKFKKLLLDKNFIKFSRESFNHYRNNSWNKIGIKISKIIC